MSFISVKYGANEERLVNPNTLASVLLHHLKTSCGFSHLLENVDLASETGEVIDLQSKSKEYAKKYLDGRATYILVKVIGDETDESAPTYVSLLEQQGGEKLKFSASRQRTKPKAGTRGEPTSTGTGGPATSKGAKAGSGFSSTTSLYEPPATQGGNRRTAGKLASSSEKSGASGAGTGGGGTKSKRK
ncbi:hypothetical protein SpCBS45565_g05057 [Spizellomyces sp. 'palustris']|nr:hypothetical protein SpCBS45565_g05057 [Spizellomyces sp. 'palustris']